MARVVRGLGPIITANAPERDQNIEMDGRSRPNRSKSVDLIPNGCRSPARPQAALELLLGGDGAGVKNPAAGRLRPCFPEMDHFPDQENESTMSPLCSGILLCSRGSGFPRITLPRHTLFLNRVHVK